MALFNGSWRKGNQKNANQNDVKDKIQGLEKSIENIEKQISEIDMSLTGFSKEEIDSYRKKKMHELEELKVRKFNLENGFDEFAFLDENPMSNVEEKKADATKIDIERRIKWLDDCIKNSRKRINDLENGLTGFPNEETDFYIKQEKKLLEEFEVRKFNLENGFDEFAFLENGFDKDYDIIRKK